jgi:phosphate transport system substrate-binding protein
VCSHRPGPPIRLPIASRWAWIVFRSLPRDVYPDIFLGKVTKWNDPRITAANPSLKLPDLPITVVRRSDSSGTTFVFTKHLSAISEAFAKEVGSGTTVQWPKSDKMVAAPKNDGITATIKQTPGAIGYIEYGYAKLCRSGSSDKLPRHAG